VIRTAGTLATIPAGFDPFLCDYLQVKEIVAASNYIIAMANAARDYRTRNMELVDQCEITFEILPWIAVRSFPLHPTECITRGQTLTRR